MAQWGLLVNGKAHPRVQHWTWGVVELARPRSHPGRTCVLAAVYKYPTFPAFALQAANTRIAKLKEQCGWWCTE
eukprot:scaffold23738_cov107-Isochrysis_galbana.AAC.1